MSGLLRDDPICHGHLKPFRHPRLRTVVNGQTAVRYLRFAQKVRVDRLELAPAVYGRWTPNVPLHPARLLISVLDPRSRRWRVICEVALPLDPRIAGRGLAQKMSAEQMDALMAKALQRSKHVIRLGGIETDHLRVECDREHATAPSHGEVNGGEFNVPFGLLNTLKAYGRPVPAAIEVAAPTYLAGLTRGLIQPTAPRGMSVERESDRIRFVGKKLSIGFSLQRPMMLHLGWDAFAKGRAPLNRLVDHKANFRHPMTSGPLLRTLSEDCLPHHWSGTVSVHGNQVRYEGLHCSVEGLRLDAIFTVEPDRVALQLVQSSDRAIDVLEAFSWVLAWDLTKGITGAMAAPTLGPGRNGDVQLPMLWAGDGIGCLSCRVVRGENRGLQVESFNRRNSVEGGFPMAPRPGHDRGAVIPKGSTRTTIEWAMTSLEPDTKSRARSSFGLASNWGAVFACFRPELGGFSNQAASCNCHQNQHGPAELVAFTKPPQHGPRPLALFRFTIERALLDGGGYGYWRELYLDSDPVLVSAAGRIHQAEPDVRWLRRIEPGLVGAVTRMLATIGPEGLAICATLTGNSGSFRWSSNAMDVVGYGHMDAYVNAWTYRALRNAVPLLAALDRRTLAQKCRAAAAALKRAFPEYLLNPDTGWVAGWRSRDGQLHDYAFTWTNGPACAFGLLEPAVARRALAGLERLRAKVGAGSGECSIPFNLLPIDARDHMLPKALGLRSSSFEMFTDGAKAASAATYYLRALAICGLKEEARRLARELDRGYAAGRWCGGAGSGVEFRCWDGMASGYEGTFVLSFGALYGIAIEQKLFAPPSPEWWPADPRMD